MALYSWSSFVSYCRIVLCCIGVVLSIYALYVEIKAVHDKTYKAFCDINSKISCSKVFTSKYGTGFGIVEPLLGEQSVLNIPNSLYGIAFYIFIFILGFFGGKEVAWAMVISSIVSCIGCVYLACILYFVLHDFCVVCISTYIVNALITALNIYHLVQLPAYKIHTE